MGIPHPNKGKHEAASARQPLSKAGTHEATGIAVPFVQEEGNMRLATWGIHRPSEKNMKRLQWATHRHAIYILSIARTLQMLITRPANHLDV